MTNDEGKLSGDQGDQEAAHGAIVEAPPREYHFHKKNDVFYDITVYHSRWRHATSHYSGKFLIIFLGEKAPHPWFEKLFFILYRFVCPSIVKQIREEETPLFLSFLTGGCLIHCIDLFSRNGFFCCTWNPPHLLGYYCVLNVLV